MKQIITPLGNVALPLDTQIDISKNNPLFSAAEEFSINLTVPRGPNEQIFGYRNRLASAATDLNTDARFLFHGREKLSGAIELVSASDDEYEILLKGSRNAFVFKYGSVNLHDIDFGTELFVPGVDGATAEQIDTEMLNTLTAGRDWICFPCNTRATPAETTNFWDFENSKFSSATGFFAAYLRLSRAIERLFVAYGYTVTENWFTDTDELNNIVIYTKGFYYAGGVMSIYNLFPKITVDEFIAGIENFFPVSILIDNNAKTVRVINDDTMLAAEVAGRFDGYITGKPKIAFNDTQDGYELTYDYPEDDTIVQDNEFADENSASEYDSYFDFPDPTPFRSTVFSRAEGAYYVSELNGETWEWRLTGNVAISVRNGDKEITKSTTVYPAMNRIVSVTQNITTIDESSPTPELMSQVMKMQVPVVTGDGDGINGDAYSWVTNFRVMVYRGMDNPSLDAWSSYQTPATPLTYPMANFVNHKMNGDQWTDQHLELRWDGDEGLRGAETIAFLNGARKITATLVMHHIELEGIDLTKVYTLQGQRVMISELVVHYGRGEKVLIDATLLMAK